ncbi:ATPase inhibitor subunit zeta [Labrys okinawensis]|uniref:ATPase inhibitor subunit zeta n=1 Tax=Labrys okinawensis TaxID=346911 RepID=UPI0039BD6BEF
MTDFDEATKMMLRNMLLGRWAAKRLGLTNGETDVYANALAKDALDPERSDVFTKIRQDFDAAGVIETDKQILEVMTELTIKAGSQLSIRDGGVQGTAAVLIARNLTSR